MTTELWNKAAAGAGGRGKELWVRVLELAYLRATKSIISKDGSPLKALEMFTGKEVSEINGGKNAVDALKTLLEAKNPHHVVVGTKQTLGEDMNEFRANHAYAVTRISNGKYVLWDPKGGASKEVTKDELIKISERFFITDLKNGDVLTNQFPELNEKNRDFVRIDAVAFVTMRGYATTQQDKLPAQVMTFEKFKVGGGEVSGGRTGNFVELKGATSLAQIDGQWFYYDTIVSDKRLLRFVREWNGTYKLEMTTATEENGRWRLGTIFTLYNQISANEKPTLRRRLEYDTTILVKNNVYSSTGEKPSFNPVVTPTFSPQYALDLFLTKPIDEVNAVQNATTSTKPVSDFWWRSLFAAPIAVSIQTKNGAINFEEGTAGVSAGFRFVTLMAIGKRKKFFYGYRENNAVTKTARVDLWLFKAQFTGDLALTSDSIGYFKELEAAYGDNLKNKFAAAFVKLLNDAPSGTLSFCALFYSALWFDYFRDVLKAKAEQIGYSGDGYRRLKLVATSAKVLASAFHDFQIEFNISFTFNPNVSAPNRQRLGDGEYGGAAGESYADKLWDMIAKSDSVRNALQDETRPLTERFTNASKAMPENSTLAVFAKLTDANTLDQYRTDVDQRASASKTIGRFGFKSGAKAALTESLLSATFEKVLSMALIALFIPSAEGNPKGMKAQIPSTTSGIAKFVVDLGGDLTRLVLSSMSSLLSDPRFWMLVALNLSDFIGKPQAEKEMRNSINRELSDTKNLTDDDSRSSRAGLRQYVIDDDIDLGNGNSELRRSGIGGAQAFDLADGKSFSSVVSDLGLKTHTQYEDLRSKIDEAARSTPGNSNLQSVANNAFKSGMTPDQRLAYDILKGNPQIPRDVLRNVVLAPNKFDTLTKGLPDSALEDLRARINTAPGAKENAVLKDMATHANANDWLKGLTGEQRDVARQLDISLKDSDSFTDPKDRRPIALALAKGGIGVAAIQNVSNAIKTISTEMRSVFGSKLNAAVFILAAIPLFIALSKGDKDQIASETANLVSGAALDIAMGLVIRSATAGFAAALVFYFFVTVAPFVEQKIKDNPWIITNKFFSLAAAAPLVAGAIQKSMDNFFKNLFGRGKGSRAIQLDALTQQQVAFLAYADVYDKVVRESDWDSDSDSAASLTLFAHLLKDNVLSSDSFTKSVKNGEFSFNDVKFKLENISDTRWADAITEYVVSAINNAQGKTFDVNEFIAGAINAFNGIESLGLGAFSGSQLAPWFWALGYNYTNRSVDNIETRVIKFENDTRDLFKSGFKKGFFTKANGRLAVDIGNTKNYPKIVAEALHYASGSKDDYLDLNELVTAFDTLNPGESHASSEQRRDHLRAAMRYHGSNEYLTKAKLKELVGNGKLRAVQGKTWINNSWQTGSILDLDFDWAYIEQQDNWGNIVADIILKSGDKVKSDSDKFKDTDLADWLINLGLLPTWSRGGDSDAKDIAKFIIRCVNPAADLGSVDYWVLNSLVWDGVISPSGKGKTIRLKIDELSGERLANGFKSLSESKDTIIGVGDILAVVKYLQWGQPVWKDGSSWRYNYKGALPWFAGTDRKANPFNELNGWIGDNFGGTLAFYDQDSGEWRFNSLEEFGKALKMQPFKKLFQLTEREGSLELLESLAPVVLDLDGDGLHFTSLAQSAAQYDIDDSGVRRNVAWTKDGLLAIDADGDGRIAKTSELSFVGYKPGAKTDLEGLTAFDTNGNGTLDAGDRDWRKFVVWIDRNGDGASDAGELATLDKIGISSINLTSDKKRQNLDGVTLHGTTTFTTKDGRKGTVGDVSFDVSTSGLSTAEIARRRDILAQAVASGNPASAAGVFTSTVTSQDSPNLFMPGGGGR